MSRADEAPGQAIAVIGMAGRFPGAPDLEAYWRAIAQGQDNITRGGVLESPAPGDDREPRRFVAARGVLDGVEDFDARFFDFTSGEAAEVDPQHRVWLELAYQALEQSGYAHDHHQQVISVFAGSFISSYLHGNLLPTRAALEEFLRLERARGFALLVRNDPAFLATRCAYKLDLRGPAINVQAGCSTSLVAIVQAVQSLLAFESDIAIAGGVCVALPQNCGYDYQEGAITSRDGYCRPYDAAACGTVFGSGGGAVVLRRLSEAESQGDPILAVLRGAAINNDGNRKVSFVAPSVSGQAEVIATALGLAGVSADTIGYVEGHGTGTPMGDPIEVEALTRVFSRDTARTEFCCLGSVKGNIGHLDAAAGVAGFIRAVLALRRRVLPPTAHFRSSHPDLRLGETPFFVLSEAEIWPDGPHPRRAGVSSFGIGGTNAHVVLEEYVPPSAPLAEGDRPVTLHLSAKHPASLEQATSDLAAYLERRAGANNQPVALNEVASTLRGRRASYSNRRAIRVQSVADALVALRTPSRWDTAVAFASRPRLFFAFPGQGSLRLPSLAALLSAEPVFADAFAQLGTVVFRVLGYELVSQLRGAIERPDVPIDGAKTQVAIFCVSVALARCLADKGIEPDALLGHSLGEWAAAHLAGMLSIEDALLAVDQRGKLMSESGTGATLSVRLSSADLMPWLTEGLFLACVNGPSACLVSGRPPAIEGLAQQLTERGVACRRLLIDVAVHSPYMDPAVEPFAEHLARLRWHEPRVPVLSSVTGEWIGADLIQNQRYFAEQLRQPVRFDQLLATLDREPGCLVLEVGLGRSLTALVSAGAVDRRRCKAIPLLVDGSIGQGPATVFDRVAGRLWTHGVEPASASAVPAGPALSDLPAYAFHRERCWIEAPGVSSEARSDEGPSVASQSVLELVTGMLFQYLGGALTSADHDRMFGELGMDSLLLLEFGERLSRAVGVRVDQVRLFEHNSINRLVEYIEQERAPESARTSDSSEPEVRPSPPSLANDFRGLVRIRAGDGRWPFFFLHGDSANELFLAHLSAEQSFTGYVHQGANGERVRLRTVEVLAEHCLSEWLAEFGDRPCVLGGHSYGGHIAYHLAHLLRQRGVQVGHLFLLDTIHPRVFRHLYNFGIRWPGRMAKLAYARLGDLLEIRKAETYLQRGEAVPEGQRSNYIISGYEIALLRYRPPPSDVPTTLFRVSSNRSNLPSNGYTEIPRLREILVQGDHVNIVRQAHLFRPIADEICGELRRLRGQS